jgi:hypothetical protein
MTVCCPSTPYKPLEIRQDCESALDHDKETGKGVRTLAILRRMVLDRNDVIGFVHIY